MSGADRLRDAMIALDRALTGKDEAVAAHMARGQSGMFEEPERFLTSDGYYLADGGYSRVIYDEDTAAFRLASVSRDEVKARWSDPQVQSAAAAAAAILTEILHRNDARPT